MMDEPRPAAVELGALARLPAVAPGAGGGLSLANVQADVVNGRLNGAVAIDEPVYEVEVSQEFGGTSFVFHSGDDQWIMVGLYVEGLGSLEPGSQIEVGSDGYVVTDGRDLLYVTVLGCEGPRQFTSDLDAHAYRIDMEVLAGASPNERTVELSAYFDPESPSRDVEDGPDELHTSFTYTLLE